MKMGKGINAERVTRERKKKMELRGAEQMDPIVIFNTVFPLGDPPSVTQTTVIHITSSFLFPAHFLYLSIQFCRLYQVQV